MKINRVKLFALKLKDGSYDSIGNMSIPYLRTNTFATGWIPSGSKWVEVEIVICTPSLRANPGATKKGKTMAKAKAAPKKAPSKAPMKKGKC